MIIESPMYGKINTNDLSKYIGEGRYYQVYKIDNSKVIKFEAEKTRVVHVQHRMSVHILLE